MVSSEAEFQITEMSFDPFFSPQDVVMCVEVGTLSCTGIAPSVGEL